MNLKKYRVATTQIFFLGRHPIFFSDLPYETQLFLKLPPWKNSGWILPYFCQGGKSTHRFKTKNRVQIKGSNVFQNLKLKNSFSNKTCFPKLIFFNEKKIRNIRMIFDVKNWLKSDFGHFWLLLQKWTKGKEYFYGHFNRPLALLIYH